MVPSSSFPTPPASSSIPLPTNLRRTFTNARGGSNLSSPNPTREVLNCLRVLGRVLPIVYEAETENAKDQDYRDVDGDPIYGQDQVYDHEQGSTDRAREGGEPRVDDRRLKEHFAWHVLWKRPLAPSSPDRARQEDAQGSGKGDQARDASMGGSDPLTRAAEQAQKRANADVDDEEEVDRLPSLTDKLFGVTVDLLFCAGFTIPENMKGADGQGDKINVGPT